MNFKRWLVCVSSSLVFFNDFLQMSFFGVLGPFFMKHYNLNALEFGQLSSIYFYSTALFILPAGVILDKFSIRKIFIIISLIYVACPILYIIFNNYLVICLGRILSGAAGSFCLIGSIAIAKRWFPKNELGLPIGVIIFIGMTGGFFAQVPFAYLSVLCGEKIALFCSSGLAVFACVAVCIFVFESPKTPLDLTKTGSKDLHESLWQHLEFILKVKPLWILGLCAGVLNIPVTLFATVWGNLYLLQTSNIVQTEIGFIISMIFIGMLIGSLIIGYAFDYMKNINKVLISSGMFTCCLLILSTFYKEFYFLTIIFLLLGISTSCHTIIYSFIAREFPTAMLGVAEGFVSSIVMIVGPAYQIMYGWLLEYQWNGTYENGLRYYSSGSHHLTLFFVCIAIFITLTVSNFGRMDPKALYVVPTNS